MGELGMSNLAEDLDHVGVNRSLLTEVLILDDSQFDRKRMRRALLRMGGKFNITEIADLAGLDAAVSVRQFDFILVDYVLTDGDGIEALTKIKASMINQDCRVIMVTGNDSSTLAVNALKLGFDDYITKDALDSNVLEGLFKSRKIQLTSKIVEFPSFLNCEFLNHQPSEIAEIAIAKLEEILEPAIKTAIDTAMARVRTDEIAENVVLLVASFKEEDEFVFRDFR